MCRKKGFPTAAAAFIALHSLSSGTGLAAVAPFQVNAGALYSTGPTPFETELHDVVIVASPRASNAPGTGQFVLRPKPANGRSGFLQIKFPGLAQPLQIACELGGPMAVLVTIGTSPGASTSHVVGTANNIVTVRTPPIAAPVDTWVSFEANAESSNNWNIDNCRVSDPN